MLERQDGMRSYGSRMRALAPQNPEPYSVRASPAGPTGLCIAPLWCSVCMGTADPRARGQAAPPPPPSTAEAGWDRVTHSDLAATTPIGGGGGGSSWRGQQGCP